MFRSFLFCILLGVFRLSAATERTELPLHFVNNIPMVNLLIDGKKVTFMLDTGASEAMYLTPDDAKLIKGVQFTGKSVKSIDLGGNKLETAELIVNDLVVNGMHFGKVRGRIRAPSGVSTQNSGPPPTSVLGLRFFADKKVLFDFGARTIKLRNANEPPPSEVSTWTTLPYDSTGEGVLVSLSSGMHRYRVVLDTASTISLVKQSSVPPNEKTENCDIDIQQGQPCRRISVRIESDPNFLPLIVNMPPEFEVDGIVGREFFDRYGVYLDMTRRLLSIKLRQAP